MIFYIIFIVFCIYSHNIAMLCQFLPNMVQYLVVGGGSGTLPGGGGWAGVASGTLPGGCGRQCVFFGVIKSNGALLVRTLAQGAADKLSFKYYSLQETTTSVSRTRCPSRRRAKIE